MQDLLSDAGTVRAVRESGARVVVQRFGGGQASLSDLQALAVDGVKIDVQPTDAGAVPPPEAPFSVGRQLGAYVIAMRVESVIQAHEAHTLGYELLQGFHLCPPLHVDGISSFLRASRQAE